MSRAYQFGLLAIAAAVGVGVWLWSQPDPADDAIDTVVQLHNAIAEANADAVRSIVDIQFRLEEMLGDVWTTAPEDDKAEAARQAQEMLDNTTRKLWTTHFATRQVTYKTRPGESPGVMWVEAHADGDDRPSFVWIYRLHQRENAETGWRVTQREYKINGMPSNTTRFYPMAIKQIGKRFNRRPTLAELNANLPSLQGKIRARHITIPKGALNKAPKKSATP